MLIQFPVLFCWLQLQGEAFVGKQGEVGQSDGAAALHVGGQADSGLAARLVMLTSFGSPVELSTIK